MFNKEEIDNILNIAKKAGDIILEYYNDYKELSTIKKEDNSPVTKADIDANNFINTKLNKLFPQIPIVSEENNEEENLKAAKNDQYFMIDPLDGTSAFIKKSDEFTVNIALIKDKKAIFGVIYLPAKDIMYFTGFDDKSYIIENYSKNGKQQQIKSNKNKDNLIVICTKREPEKTQIIDDLKTRNIKIKKIISVASSYKFCLIAEGKADLYPRKVNIKAWDVAAGHAIVNGAKSNMIDVKNKKEVEYKFDKNFNVPVFEVF